MLKRVGFVGRHYVGCTGELKERLRAHNAGELPHTGKFRPWSLHGYIAFSDPEKADKFEMYLKSGAGRAFAKRHF
jgi:putative endonuclease